MREPGLGLRSGSLSARRGMAVPALRLAGSRAAEPPVATPSAMGALTWCWQPPFPLDLARTMGVHQRGRGDPTYLTDGSGAAWRTSLTPDGPATMRVHATPGGSGAADEGAGGRPTVRAMAWGPGAAWLLASLPGLLGASDDPGSFTPVHPLVGEMSRRHPGLRIGRSGRVIEALVPAVLEQKVVGAEAKRAWRLLVLKFGGPAPGPAPAGMRVCPPPRTWTLIPSWEWHRAGVELVRARTIIGACRVAHKLEEITTMAAADADHRLQALSGIGPWTSAEIRQRACGDPDAVSVGDYHLPSIVGWALTRQKVDDAGMLELLAPYAGHRHRAARLLVLSGMGPPRHGPRNAPRDYRRI